MKFYFDSSNNLLEQNVSNGQTNLTIIKEEETCTREAKNQINSPNNKEFCQPDENQEINGHLGKINPIKSSCKKGVFSFLFKRKKSKSMPDMSKI